MKSDMTLRIFLTIVLLFAVAGNSLAQEKSTTELWDLYQAGKFTEVVVTGQALLDSGSEDPQVCLAIGRAHVDMGEYAAALPLLQRAVEGDTAKTWVYAWGQNYSANAHYLLGDKELARREWILARDCAATRNATRNAANSLVLFGLDETFDDWFELETEHFLFRFSKKLEDFDRDRFASRREQAYEKICAWFEGGPSEKVLYIVWGDQEEATARGVRSLGFAKPSLNLIHSLPNQTAGHEMTHVISHHARSPQSVCGLINEGTAIYQDQTGRDQMKRARAAFAEREIQDADEDAPTPVRVAIKALWEDWSLMPQEQAYPVAGAFVAKLVERGGKEKYLEFFGDQSLAHATAVYGADLQKWIEEFERQLYD